MNCSEFSELLDRYIDGELDGDQRAAFLNHVNLCAECREQLQAAEQIRDILSHMDEDIAVPLPAQAAWRNAVRKEAQRRRMKRIYSAVGAVAAMCVLTFGVTAMLRSQPVSIPEKANETAVVTETQLAYVETDGVSEDAVLEASAATMMVRSMPVPEPYAERRVVTDDAAAARTYLADVVAEYDGFIERESEESGVLEVYLRIPSENIEDFINVVDHIGAPAEEAAFLYDTSADSVGVCVIFAAN